LDFAHMKEGKTEGKRRLILRPHHMLPFAPSAIAPCCMHLRMSWLFPSHSCHTQKTHTQLPFPPPSHQPSNLTCFSFLLLHSNTSILSALFSCSFAPNFSAAILGAISVDCVVFFFRGVFFAQKCCFFVNLQLLVCLFFDLLAIDKLLQVHSNSTEL
jgi:hypothetical protein